MLNPLSPAFWLITGLVLLTMEVVTPGFVIFFFGLAAVIVGLLSLVLPLSFALQMLLFAVFTVASLFVLRKHMSRLFTGRRVNDDAREIEDTCVGQSAVVEQRITGKAGGRVEFHGATWLAVADEDIEVGTPVEIISRNSLTLLVKRR